MNFEFPSHFIPDSIISWLANFKPAIPVQSKTVFVKFPPECVAILVNASVIVSLLVHALFRIYRICSRNKGSYASEGGNDAHLFF